MTRRILFHEDLVEDIVRGKKRCTLRHDWEEVPNPGDVVHLVNASNGEVFSEATVSAVGKTTIRDFQEHGFPEHTQYQNVEEAVKKFNYFYPNNDFTPETEMDMIWFRVVEEKEREIV